MNRLKIAHALPTWILTNILIPFVPESHKWKNKRFSLSDWAKGRTEVCCHFDNIFWVWIIGAFFITLTLTR